MKLTTILPVLTSGILFSVVSYIDAFPGNDVEECYEPPCCEEDCCGSGTSWASPYCIVDTSSGGFQGKHSDSYDPDCCPRVCCESDCCGNGTYYDLFADYCLPGPCDCDKFRQAIQQAEQQVADETQALENAQTLIDAAESVLSTVEADAASASQSLDEAEDSVDSQSDILESLQLDLQVAIEAETSAAEESIQADDAIEPTALTTEEMGNRISEAIAPIGNLTLAFNQSEIILTEKLALYDASVEHLDNGQGTQEEVVCQVLHSEKQLNGESSDSQQPLGADGYGRAGFGRAVNMNIDAQRF